MTENTVEFQFIIKEEQGQLRVEITTSYTDTLEVGDVYHGQYDRLSYDQLEEEAMALMVPPTERGELVKALLSRRRHMSHYADFSSYTETDLAVAKQVMGEQSPFLEWNRADWQAFFSGQEGKGRTLWQGTTPTAYWLRKADKHFFDVFGKNVKRRLQPDEGIVSWCGQDVEMTSEEAFGEFEPRGESLRLAQCRYPRKGDRSYYVRAQDENRPPINSMLVTRVPEPVHIPKPALHKLMRLRDCTVLPWRNSLVQRKTRAIMFTRYDKQALLRTYRNGDAYVVGIPISVSDQTKRDLDTYNLPHIVGDVRIPRTITRQNVQWTGYNNRSFYEAMIDVVALALVAKDWLPLDILCRIRTYLMGQVRDDAIIGDWKELLAIGARFSADTLVAYSPPLRDGYTASHSFRWVIVRGRATVAAWHQNVVVWDVVEQSYIEDQDKTFMLVMAFQPQEVREVGAAPGRLEVFAAGGGRAVIPMLFERDHPLMAYGGKYWYEFEDYSIAYARRCVIEHDFSLARIHFLTGEQRYSVGEYGKFFGEPKGTLVSPFVGEVK